MHVVQVPSWYPTGTNPMNGSFFAEQFEMLRSEGIEVGVIAPTMVAFGRSLGINEHADGHILRLDLPALPRPLVALERIMRTRTAERIAKEYERSYGVPDVLHAHSVFPGAVFARELAQYWDRPYVITEHRPSSILVGYTGARGEDVRRAVREASSLAAVSAAFSAELEKYYDSGPWQTIDLPVPEQFFQTVAPPSKSAYTFLHVSHLDHNKRPHQLCRVFNRVFGDMPGIRLQIIGGNDATVAETKGSSGIVGDWPANIEFLGTMPREELAQQMSQADCFVLTSAAEAGGTVLSETQATGTPFIATETWAGASAQQQGIGLLVPIDDDDALADALHTAALLHPFLSRKEIRSRATSRYSAKIFVRNQEAVYQNVAHSSQTHLDPNKSIPDAHGRTVVFHSPTKMFLPGRTASSLRPKRMREAFVNLGYSVVTIEGSANQRRKQMRRLLRSMRSGLKVDLVYSELASVPLALTQSIRTGIHPFLDLRFFSKMTRKGVPVGAFYRDIYWKFEKRDSTHRGAYARLSRFFFRMDEKLLPKSVSWLFLPSILMADYMDFPTDRVSALPPGTTMVPGEHPQTVHLQYVGALGDFYRIHRLVEAVSEVPMVHLNLCVPAEQWALAKNEYQGILGPNTEIVHVSGKELGELYRGASIGVLCVEPTEYRSFAAPYKLYEYLGHGLPVVTTAGTLAADFIEECGAGWVVDYDTDKIVQLISRLAANPEQVRVAQSVASEVGKSQTWENRAIEVVRILSKTKE